MRALPLALPALFGLAIACGGDSKGGRGGGAKDGGGGEPGEGAGGASSASGGASNASGGASSAAGGQGGRSGGAPGSTGGSPASGGGGRGAGGSEAGGGGPSGGGSGSGGAEGPGGAYPDAATTGIPVNGCPGGLTNAGQSELRPDSNATIECVRFQDDLPYIAQDVSGVTFRKCRFELSVPSGDAFVNVQGAGVTFEDSEFAGGAGTWIRTSYEGRDLTLRRSDLSGMANAIEFGTPGLVIEDNYVHDFGNVEPSQHADGIQTDGSGVSTKAVIRHNTVLLNEVDGATATLGIWADLDDLDDVLAEDNLLAGGGYTVYPGVEGGGFHATNIRFIGNRFSTMFHDTCGAYGPKYPTNLPATLVWEGNVWHDGPQVGTPVE